MKTLSPNSNDHQNSLPYKKMRNISKYQKRIRLFWTLPLLYRVGFRVINQIVFCSILDRLLQRLFITKWKSHPTSGHLSSSWRCLGAVFYCTQFVISAIFNLIAISSPFDHLTQSILLRHQLLISPKKISSRINIYYPVYIRFLISINDTNFGIWN